MRDYAYDIGQEFGISQAVGFSVMGFDPSRAHAEDSAFVPVPAKVQEYVFEPEVLSPLISRLDDHRGRGVWLSGPHGTGKTSVIEQTAARLNWPVVAIGGTNSFEAGSFLGYVGLVSDVPGGPTSTKWIDGPLPLAMKTGAILLINEVDLIPPGELAVLNDVMEGKPLVLTENGGEVIHPADSFRIAVTGNSGGRGDASGRYSGVQVQNIALVDRFEKMTVGYMSEDQELKLLKCSEPSVPEKILKAMVNVANESRRAYVGDLENGVSPSLGTVISTRALKSWADNFSRLSSTSKPNALYIALGLAVTNGIDPADRIALEKIVEAIFGQRKQ